MRRALVLLACLLLARPGYADPSAGFANDDQVTDGGHSDLLRFDRRWRYPLMLLETSMILVPPTIYYWNSVSQQKEDWVIRWDWESWKKKLFTSDGLVLDTNRFTPNGIRHPMTGALSYQVGRANGLGPFGSTVLDLGTSVFWEYIVEYRELPSLNDIFTNTVSGFLIGEPLFQIGRLGDPGGSWPRRGMSLIASPFHRAQETVRMSWLDAVPRPSNELGMSLGSTGVRLEDGTMRAEAAFALDLFAVREPRFGRPGQGTSYSGLAAWNRADLDLRLGAAEGASGIPGARFRSETTYASWYHRDLDADGDGTARLTAMAAGFELHQRRLGNEWDKLSVFELIGPRFDLYHRTADIDITWQVAGYVNVALVQAHVFGQTPMSGTDSVLRWRGYYYATGTSLATRLRVQSGRWDGLAEATGHGFWSIDADEHASGADPKNVADQRLTATTRIGFRTTEDIMVYGFGETVLRRGTWETMERDTKELDLGLGLRVGF